MEEQQYAGFWIRVFAAIIDSVVVIMILAPFAMMMGVSESEEIFSTMDIILNLALIAATIAFWVYKGATPGKMLTKIKIVDAETGGNLSLGKCIIRYIGYIVGMIPFFLGLIWIGFDKKKQGWHDKMASSVVIKSN